MNQRTESARGDNDGHASVGLGVHVMEYYENKEGFPSYGRDYAQIAISATANTRKILSYRVYRDDSEYCWHDNLPNVINLPGDMRDNEYRVLTFGDVTFRFRFFGGAGSAEYGGLCVTDNGVICLDPKKPFEYPYYSYAIPSPSEPNTFVAPFWRDLKPEAGVGTITYGIVTHNVWSGPTKCFCISWNNVKDKNFNPQTFQVLLEDAPTGLKKLQQSRIWFQYKSITKNDDKTVIGIEDQQGGKGESYDFRNLATLNSVLAFEQKTTYQSANAALISSLTIQLACSNYTTAYTKIEPAGEEICGQGLALGTAPPKGSMWGYSLSGYGVLLVSGAIGFQFGPLAGVMFDVTMVSLEVISQYLNALKPSTIVSDNTDWRTYIKAYAINYNSNAPLVSDTVDANFNILIYWIFNSDDPKVRNDLSITAKMEYYEYDVSGPFPYQVGGMKTISTSVSVGMGADNNNDLLHAQPVWCGMNFLYLGGYDNVDYYKVYITETSRLLVNATAIPDNTSHRTFYLNLSLSICDPSANTRNSTTYGKHESTSFVTDSVGDWYIKVLPLIGGGGDYGFYNLTVWVQTPWPPSGGGGCPVLYVFDGSGYCCEGLLNIHNPNCTDVVMNHTLAAVPACTWGTYSMRLVEHNKTVSHIDQVKLYANLENGMTVSLPLIYAWHSKNGYVLPQLLLSDDWRTDTYGADWNNGTSQSINLKFLAPPPRIRATSFTFQIEGYNPLPK